MSGEPGAHAEARGGVLVAPGLNCSSAAMGAFVRLLTEAGYAVLPLTFRRCRGADARPAFEEVWLEDFAAGYRRLEELCPGLPLYHLGFSLGALVGVRFLQQSSAARFERMALLAPALSLCAAARLLPLLLPLDRFGLSLPSLCPAAFRDRRLTPLGEYRALLRVVDEVGAAGLGGPVSATPTVVFMDPRDELVHYPGVARWIDRNGRPGWTLRPVRRDPSVGGFRFHLLLEEAWAGPRCWAELRRGILAHFTAKEP